MGKSLIVTNIADWWQFQKYNKIGTLKRREKAATSEKTWKNKSSKMLT
jgi:hypothetical protein